MPLGIAFSVLFVVGKWKAWQLTIQSMGWKSLPLGLLSAVPSQGAIVGLFYGPCLGLMLLTGSERTIAPYGSFDTKFAGGVLFVGLALAMGAHYMELQAEARATQIET